MRLEKLMFPGEQHSLEGVLTIPQEGAGQPAAVICHPHPQFGGDMHNNVVMGISDALTKAGIGALRFNFRGVGRSGGSYSGGPGEEKDTCAALNYLASRQGEDAPLFLAGYSFGAIVGLAAAVKDSRVKAWVAISPPLVMSDFAFLASSRQPKLLLSGDRDQFCPLDEFKRLFDRLNEPKRMQVFPGVDHFYWNAEVEAGRLAAEFFSSFKEKN